MEPNSIDVVFSFDTTGSMYPCLTQVRRNVSQTINRLFDEIPGLRIGIIAHGDYCDGDMAISKLDLSRDEHRITDFVNGVRSTSGGDSPECYEQVLKTARGLSWTAGRSKVLVIIGDDVPHGPEYRYNTDKVDWRNELSLLLEAGINVYGVQALGRSHATPFYREIAEKTGGFHLTLNQFSEVTDLIMAVCYRQDGTERVKLHYDAVQSRGGLSRTLSQNISKMAGVPDRWVDVSKPTPKITWVGREFSESELEPVHPARFQVLYVDTDETITSFVYRNGLSFMPGKGFYELTKPVNVQAYKEVVLRHKATGDFFTGPAARAMVGLPSYDARLHPVYMKDYQVFIQSTSYNRKLIGGTHFLYEVADWSY